MTIHIVLIILALVACWYHLIPHFGFKVRVNKLLSSTRLTYPAPWIQFGESGNGTSAKQLSLPSQYGYQVWLYICFAFWSADRAARLARLVYYNRLGDAKAIVEVIPGCKILHVTVFPRVIRGIGPGQHTFLYFPGLGKFWESHPFSIAAWEAHEAPAQSSASASSASAKGDGVYSTTKELDTASVPVPAADSNSHHMKPVTTTTRHRDAAAQEAQKYNNVSFQLLIRAHSGMTGALERHLSSPTTRSRVEVSVYTEGYYAGHNATLHPLLTADTVLCLVGGLGITNALGFVQEYVGGASSLEGETGSKSRGVMKRATRFILAWSAKEIEFIDYVKKNFLVDSRGVECLFWHTGSSEGAMQMSESSKEGVAQYMESNGPTVTTGRMHIASVIRSSLEAGRQTTVLVCGPGQMADEARRQVVNCVKDGFSVDLIEEAFAW